MNTDFERVNKLVSAIKQERDRVMKNQEGLPMAPPPIIDDACNRISVLLTHISEPLSRLQGDVEVDKAKLYHQTLKAGVKPSPAKDVVRFDVDLVQRERDIAVIENFLKEIRSMVMKFAGHLRLESLKGQG